MRVIYKGYAATTYGQHSLSITDSVGKEVFHTDDRTVETEEDLKKTLKDFVKNQGESADFCESCVLPVKGE